MSDETEPKDPHAHWPVEWWALLSDEQVMARYGIRTKDTLNDKRNAGELPKPLKRSPVQGNRTLLGDVIEDMRRRVDAEMRQMEGR